MHKSDAILATQMWLNETVIGLNLCPFAKGARDAGKINYFVTEVTTELDLITELEKQLYELVSDDSVETCLLIHPNALNDFDDYNQFLDNADSLLELMKLDGVIQIASFHPDYLFAGTIDKATENFTNRSPFPMVHLLRESSVQYAVDSYPDIDNIAERNIKHMNSLDYEDLVSKLSNFQNILNSNRS